MIPSWSSFLLAVSVFIAVSWMLSSFSKLSQMIVVSESGSESDFPNNDRPIRALLQVLTPRTSHWPKAYLLACAKAESDPRRQIFLPLERLVTDMALGNIELRNPCEDLPCLILEGLAVRGWIVSIIPDSGSVQMDLGYLCFGWLAKVRSVWPECISLQSPKQAPVRSLGWSPFSPGADSDQIFGLWP